jgi:hypothetical protein
MSSGTPSSSHSNQTWSEGQFLPRWAWWLIAPGLAMPVCIVAFLGIAQLAHDEQRCPFHEHGVQQLGNGASVIEEARQCMPGTEERRYRLRRGDRLQVLGERRFSRDSFAPDKFSWTASINARGEAQVVLHDRTHGDVLFREGTAQEHAGGPLQPLPAK